MPGAHDGPPYVLDRPDETYVLTEDVVADGTAFVVTADDVTLDLNGHEVVCSAGPRAEISNANPETAQTGIYARSVRGLRVLAGRLREGHVGNRADPSQRGLHALFLDGCEDVELAGLTGYSRAAGSLPPPGTRSAAARSGADRKARFRMARGEAGEAAAALDVGHRDGWRRT